jgi:hypothetical protein
VARLWLYTSAHYEAIASVDTSFQFLRPSQPQDGFRSILPRPQGQGNGNYSLLVLASMLMCCQTLLARNYRGDIPMSAVEKFPILLSDAEEESSAVPPCFSDEGINVWEDPYIGKHMLKS